MKIDVNNFIGLCECGKEHGMVIKKILLEPGALERIPEVAKELGLNGKALIICDKNTWAAAGKRVAELLPNNKVITIQQEDIHPNEKTVEEIESQYPDDIDFIVGVGGGVLTDTSKYIGFKHGGVPVLLVPTAASVDGFAANSSIMTFNHFKHPLTTQAAVAIVADSTVLAAAPYRLIASGIGDLLGKYVALADWDFAHLITGEALCPRIYSMVNDAVAGALAVADRLKNNDEEAVEALMYALILAGLTIQMWGSSRPASGAEHQIGHVWELAIISPEIDALHGECVGVGTISAKKFYEKLIATIGDKPEDFFHDYKGFPHQLLKDSLGDVVYGELMPYNTPDEGERVNRQDLIDNWAEICRMHEVMPTSAEMEKLFKECGMKITLEDLGLSSYVLPLTLQTGAYVRGRISLYRVWHGFTNIDIDIRS